MNIPSDFTFSIKKDLVNLKHKNQNTTEPFYCSFPNINQMLEENGFWNIPKSGYNFQHSHCETCAKIILTNLGFQNED